MTWWERVLDLFYPPRCVTCHQRGSLFCATCVQSCRALHEHSRTNTNYINTELLAVARGLYAYDPPLREAIHALKYDGLKGLAAPLAALMASQVERLQLLPADAALAWVPLHVARGRERGFNQAELLARRMAQLLGLSLAPGLSRIRATPSQVGMDAQQRQANVRNAFIWQAPVSPPERVVIIDDVLTTGATLDACAAALHGAGTIEVYGLALAAAGGST